MKIDNQTIILAGALGLGAYFLSQRNGGTNGTNPSFNINAEVEVPGYGKLPAHLAPDGTQWVFFQGHWILFAQLQQLWASQQSSGNTAQQIGEWLLNNSGSIISTLKDLGILK